MRKACIKGFSLLLAVVMLCSVTACGTQSSSNSSAPTPAQSVAAAESSAAESPVPAEVSGKFTMWTHDDSLNVYNPFLEKAIPNIETEIVVMDDDDIRTKLKTVLSAGATPPDLVQIEIGMWKELMELPIWQNLADAPYSAQPLLDEQYEYIQQMSKDASGAIVGLTNQATPAGYYYRRSIAKEAFGTDDPQLISAKLKDWPTVLETGKEVYAKTGRALFPVINDVVQVQSNISKTPWVVGDEIRITDDMLKTLDLIKEMDEAHVVGRMDMWSPEWNAEVENGEVSMGLFIATWMMAYNIKPNAPSTKGDWGFAEMISPQFMGGSWFAMPEGAKNKEQAWEYLKTICTNHEFLDWFSTEIGDFSSNKVVNEELSQKNPADEFWGGQNIIKTFSDVASTANGNMMYLNQNDMLSCMRGAVREYAYNGKTREEAIEVLKENFKTRLPNLTIVEE